MAYHIQQLGDHTSHEVRPDFDSGKGEYWMRQMKNIQQHGTPVKNWPRKPRKTLAEHSYFEQVDRRLSRQTYVMGASFDKDGKLIREDQ